MPERFNAKDALADYVTVPQRIAQFYELFGTGRLVTGEVRVELGPDGKPRVMVQAAAYRTPDDPLPGIGWSWMELPGTTSFTRGSELENTETSAWGRAIAALGILVDRSVASANEVANKKSDDKESRQVVQPPTGEPVPVHQNADTDLEPMGEWLGTGAIGIGKAPFEGQRRDTPEGTLLGFKFDTVDNKTIPQVEVRGSLAEDLYDAANGTLKGLVATVSGNLFRVVWYKDGRNKAPVRFQRLHLRHISTAAWSLPVAGQTGPGLFDPETEAELDAAL